jgi:hypothetical protein
MTYKLHTKSFDTLLRLEPQLRVADDRTLSVYLPVRAEGFEASHYDLLLNRLAAEHHHRLTEKERVLMEHELERVRTHLKVVRPAGIPGIAAFSNESVGLLALIRLPDSIEPRIEVGQLLLEPLELMMQRFQPALVVVVDKREARTFAAILGEVIPLAHVKGQDVRHSKAGGTSASSNQRKADNRTRANLKKVVEVIDKEVRTDEFNRIFVAGPEEARTELVHELPKHLAGLVAGHLSASLETPPGKLMGEIRDQVARLGDSK